MFARVVVADADGFEALGDAIFGRVLGKLCLTRPTTAYITEIAREVHSTPLARKMRSPSVGARFTVADIETIVRGHFDDSVVTDGISLKSRMYIQGLVAMYGVRQLGVRQGQVSGLIREAETEVMSSGLLHE